MKVTSSAIVNGYWEDRFGKHGEQKTAAGKASRSVPFAIEDAPEGTVCYAAVLDDMDAIPVCGFCWIHWSLCGLTSAEVAENASVSAPDFIQGCTSFHSAAGDESIEEASNYGGMAPPDQDHEYTLTVYALDTAPDLKPGYYVNELHHAMKGHILAEAAVSAMYRA